MELLIVTGRSGAGKSRAISTLEDLGFVCIDNMPPQLIPSFGQLLVKTGAEDMRYAIVVDVRAGKSFQTLFESLDVLQEEGVHYQILYLDCSDGVLLRRFKETRRRHPLEGSDGVEEALSKERKLLEPLKAVADYYVDTTHTTSAQLKERIDGLFTEKRQDRITITVLSFGFKFGMPMDADVVYDVRCLPNPFYIPELKPKTGLNEEVSNYVLSFDSSKILLSKLTDLLDFSIPLYITEGKSHLILAMGCTGGKHRSVTFAEAIAKHLSKQGYRVNVQHRDIEK